MSTQIFTLTNLNDLLSYLSAVNVIDLDPCEAKSIFCRSMQAVSASLERS